MEAREYTEDELRKAKYNELLKIGRNLGMKSRRMKTDKLIETILSLQEERLLQKEAEAVANEVAVVSADHSEEKDVMVPEKCGDGEELLTDIQFPKLVSSGEESSAEDESLAVKDDRCNKAAVKRGRGRRVTQKQFRTRAFEVKEEKQVQGSEEVVTGSKRHRTSTFDVSGEGGVDGMVEKTGNESSPENKCNSKSKRRRTSTFVILKEGKVEMMSEDGPKSSTSPEKGGEIKPELRRTSTFDVSKNKNMQEPLKREGTFELEKMKQEPENIEKGDSKPKRRRTSTFDIFKEENVEEPLKYKGAVEMEKEKQETENAVKLKRQRTSAFNSPKDDEKMPLELNSSVDINQEQTEENSRQLNLLTHRLNRSSKGLETANSPAEENMLVAGNTSADKSYENFNQNSKKLRGRNQGKSATPSTCTFQAGLRVDGNRKSSGVPQGAKILKPVFTVGRGDTENKGSNDGTNIPRFVSYARKLKVPNFAKIHERAFNRMEALDDYMDKKRKRTETISSCKKMHQAAPVNVFQPSITSIKNLNINFGSSSSPALSQASSKPKTPRTEIKKPRPSETTADQKSTKKLLTVNKSVTQTSCITHLKSPAPVNDQNKPCSVTYRKTAKGQFSKTLKKPAVPTRKSPRSFNSTLNPTSQIKTKTDTGSVKHSHVLQQQLKENVKPEYQSLLSPTSLKNKPTPESAARWSKTVTHIPHRVPVKPRETLKKLAEKQPALKSREEIRENQKRILKGVRFNRRFELQMANRGISLQ